MTDTEHAKEMRDALVGKSITEVRYMTNAEASERGWLHRPLIIFIEGGQFIIPNRDDEGNDGGALEHSFVDGGYVLFAEHNSFRLKID